MQRDELIVHIDWQGPIPATDIDGLRDAATEPGVYAIYGPHNVYGPSALLYIGKSERATALRVVEHNWHSYERKDEIEVHTGRLHVSSGELTECLTAVERLLIYAHGPAYNSAGVQDPHADSPASQIRIFNWHSYRSLLPEISGTRWLRTFEQNLQHRPGAWNQT